MCDGRPLDEAAYAYLLGLYLGDGSISRHPRTYRLRIFQDQRYPLLIALGRRTIARVRGDEERTVGVVHEVGWFASPPTGTTGHAYSRSTAPA